MGHYRVDLVAFDFLVLNELSVVERDFSVGIHGDDVPDVDLALTITHKHSIVTVKDDCVGVVLIHNVLIALRNLVLSCGVNPLVIHAFGHGFLQVIWSVLWVHDKLERLIL